MAVRRTSSRLEIRLSPMERANLRHLAAAHGLPLSRYLVGAGSGSSARAWTS